MRALVTGANGFIGRHLVAALLGDGADVVALVRPGAAPPPGSIRIVRGDITDESLLVATLGEHRPDVVYHLAANSEVTGSWNHPWNTLRVNTGGTLNLLQALRTTALDSRLVAVCSSAEYGSPPQGHLAAEDDALRPDSPYGVSKLAADVLCTAFARAFGLDVVTARPFSIVGPGKTGDVVFDIVQAIVAAEAGGPRTVPIGDVSSVRDFVPVADAVSALMTIAASGASGTAYNICTGVPRTVRWVVGQLCERALVEVTSVSSPERMRPADTPFLVGDPQRLTELGWRPGQALEDCLSETLRYWRQIAP